MNWTDLFTTGVIIVAVAALVMYVGLIVLAVVQVVRSTSLEVLTKGLWVLAILAFPLLGTMAWYLVGDRIGELGRRLGLTHSFGR